MTKITVQNSSREIAVCDHRSVTRTLHQVADLMDCIPDLAKGHFQSGRFVENCSTYTIAMNRLSEDTKRWIAEDKAIIASGAYKQAIAMLSPLAAPPPVDLVSEQIIALIESKPFGHMVSPGFTRQVIEEISYMDPVPSIAAVMAAFREMRLTLGENVPGLGSLIKCIATAEERFQGKYGPLLKLEDRLRRRVALLPKMIEKERAGASLEEVYVWSLRAMSDGTETHQREQGLDLSGLQAFLSPSMSSPPLTPRAPAIADGDTDGDTDGDLLD
jgi:hypothetical protein